VVGKDDAEVKQRAAAIGRDVAELKSGAIAGTPAEVVDRLGQFAAVGSTRQYVQIMDLQDLAHLDLIAAEVLPQVS
jgi:alkanesulfonate monooxygenase SsuD/methylene tetrahydromethanopterin reductase-like flavin-dependent oxidoreductase (luciferase family)